MTNYKVNTNSELYHHGILGQRWGVRRYQNKDGSRIKGAASRAYNSGAFDKTVKSGKERVSPAEYTTKSARNAVNETKQISSGIKKLKKNKTQDLSSMSDAELRAAVNRLNLERQYNQLTAESKKTGSDYADGLLDIIGGVAGITGSVVGTIALIKSMKG